MAAQKQPQTFEGENLLTEITRHVFIVMLHVSWPKMKYQIADAIVEIKDKNDKKKEIAEQFRSNPQWQLMPEEWRKKLGSLESHARALLSTASVQFATRGMSVLPVTRASRVFAALRKLRKEMNDYRDEFVKEYKAILEQLEAQLGKDLYREAATKLPEASEVADKFSIIWAIVPAGGQSNITESQLDQVIDTLVALSEGRDEDLIACDAAIALLTRVRDQGETTLTEAQADDLVLEAREQMSKFTEQMLADMSAEPRRVLLDATDNLLEALRDPGRVIRTGTIEQVRRAFEMVEGFSFLASKDLLDQIQLCRVRVEAVTPQQLNADVEIGARLAAGLQGLRDEAADAKSAAAATRRFRGVRIRKRQPQP